MARRPHIIQPTRLLIAQEADPGPMRAILVALALMTVAFAGCASDAPKGEATDGATTGSGSASSSAAPTASATSSATSTTSSSGGTSTGAPAAHNTAPTGSISAVINGTNVAFALNGTDADGDSLSWNLTFGDGTSTSGSTLPGSVTHSYTAGNYSARLNLTDGKATTSYNVSISVTGAGAGSGPLQSIKGGWAVGVVDGGMSSEIFLCGSSPLAGVTHFRFPIAAETHGAPFQATVTDASGGEAMESWAIYFFQAGCLAFDSFDAAGNAPIAGTVPAGAAYGAAISAGGADLELTYTAG